MSSFDIRPDAPGLLRAESLNTTIKFDRTSDTTARVSWNIPVPAAGCAAGDQAYCGMLVTLDTKPATASSSPVNGQMYSSDPTGSTNLHAGDKLNAALVVGAFYGDRETTFFDITGLSPNTAYYVSGYPTDCQFRYFREGIHAYSLDLKSNGTACTSSTQHVALNVNLNPSGVNLTDSTTLDSLAQYDFSIQLGVVPRENRPLGVDECVIEPPKFTVVVDGANSQTYGDLIDEINKQLSLIDSPIISPTAPYTNTYVLRGNPRKLYIWNGYTHEELPFIDQATAPNIVNLNALWLDSDTLILSKWNGTAWVQTNYVAFATDPTLPICNDSVWLNGSNGYEWNGTTWCELVTYSQATDPSLVNIECGSFWFNSNTNYLYSWNENTHGWVSIDAIQSTIDPSALPQGSYWYNETTRLLQIRGALNTWSTVPNVKYTELEPTTPMTGTVWYNPTDNILQIRNLLNTGWDTFEAIAYPTDPTSIDSCEFWWKDDGSVSELYVWSVTTSAWVLVTKFYNQAIDPALPPTIPQHSLWIDTDNDIVYQYDNACFTPITPIISTVDPTLLPNGTNWYNTTTSLLYVRVLGVWQLANPILSANDPTMLPVGTFWYNASATSLSMWNGASWVAIGFTTNFINPSTGLLWYNTTTDQLLSWNGTSYDLATPRATVELNCNNQLLFTDKTCGSLSFIRITDGNLFSSLNVPFSIGLTTPGSDGVSDLPSYVEEGIGTDGSGDERLQLANEIRYALGYPSVDVELTPEQIDLAITMAISELRMKSSIAYKRAFFFMRTIGNEQRYFLTNKISGMHKIVTVMGVTRLTSSFLSSAHGAGVYGQIILQQLYNMGNFDILTYHLQAEYVKTLEIMFAGRVTFTWNEHTRELFMHNRMPFAERVVLLETMVERTEQDLINDRWTKEWVRRFATAKCKEMLSQVRGKFSTLPGAGGSVSLNASDLMTQATEEIRICHEEIEDFVVDRPEELGYTTSFVFG